MDPVTQSVLGAVTAQAVLRPAHGQRVWLAGLAGGLLPDADVVLQSLSDPALPWELHRHFTHAYAMAPAMGLLAGAVLLLVPWFRSAWRVTLLAAVIGALTHAPLDLMTSYGTKVYWPFSLENATADLYPIIDPLFTLVLIAGLALAVRRRARRPAVLALVFVLLYTGAALHQREAALEAQARLAAQRGHVPVRARVMPLPASLLAWRSLYEVDGRMVADIVRHTPWGGTQVVPGGSVEFLREDDVLAGVPAEDHERVRSVFRRYAHFADGWTAQLPGEPGTIGDMRFSIGPGFRPPWALRLAAAPAEPPVRWEQPSFARGAAGALLAVILGSSDALRSIESLAADPAAAGNEETR